MCDAAKSSKGNQKTAYHNIDSILAWKISLLHCQEIKVR